ncbi:MAG: transposase [Sulfuricella sp.]|nr:transposase [Sulfuricella sp.]
MPDYRRNRVPGGTYFFTVNLLERSSRLLTEHIDELRAAVVKVRRVRPFHVDAWVVLPEHMHCVWTLPEGDADYPARWRAIKIAFVKALPFVEPRSAVRVAKGERGIWQRRYWEHTIRDERDYAAHLDYVHFNPVKHGHAAQVADWPYSSFHGLVEKGVYPRDWGGGSVDIADTGEP